MAGPTLPAQLATWDERSVPLGWRLARAALAHEVHIWHVQPDALRQPGLLAACDALMTPEERERGARFVFEQHQHQHRVTRALVRTLLSTYCPKVPPTGWQFESNPYGRPEIAVPLLDPPLRFNLSHTDGMIVCLVTGDRQAGVDVEDVLRDTPTVEIADRFFSPSEVRALHALPREDQHERFFAYWTLKESYIKARGLGLQIPLDQFTFEIFPSPPPPLPRGERGDPRDLRESPKLPVGSPSPDAGDTAQPRGPALVQAGRGGQGVRAPITISFGPEIRDYPATWQFGALHLTERHRLALAVRRSEQDLGVRIRPALPLLQSLTPDAAREARDRVGVV